MSTATPRRPLIRYHGGKWKLAPWIISHFPSHRVYVEPFGGGASVLLRKTRSHAEVYNDLDGELVNLFRVVRDEGDRLKHLLELTPFSRSEFDLSFKSSRDPVEQARRTVIRSYMGFGSTLTRATRQGLPMRTGFRADSSRSGSTPARDWQSLPDHLPAVIARLRGVVIENRSAMEVMVTHDGPSTLHYVDPPYVHSTRSVLGGAAHRGYRHELEDDDHIAVARALNNLAGAVILSGYHCELYDDLYRDWQRVECTAFADGAKKRTEVLWLRNVDRGLLL